MGQVLVPRAGSCPDKVGAEIAMGQYSAVATWSCGWSHLRGSRQEKGTGSLPPPIPAVCWGRCSCCSSPPLSGDGEPPLLLDPRASPSHLFPLPCSHPAPFSCSWGKAKVSASPTVNNSRGIAAFPFITLAPNPSCYLCACPPRLSQCSAMPSLHPVKPQCPHILAGGVFLHVWGSHHRSPHMRHQNSHINGASACALSSREKAPVAGKTATRVIHSLLWLEKAAVAINPGVVHPRLLLELGFVEHLFGAEWVPWEESVKFY